MYDLLGGNYEGEFHVFKIYHGGVVVEVVDVCAHKHSQDGGYHTVEENIGCDQDCKLCGGGPLV